MAAPFKDLSKDILDVDTKFPLNTLPSMKEFLAYQARKEEAKKVYEEYDSWDDNESPEPSPLRRPKRAPTAESALPEEGLSQELPLPTKEESRQRFLPKEYPPLTDYVQP